MKSSEDPSSSSTSPEEASYNWIELLPAYAKIIGKHVDLGGAGQRIPLSLIDVKVAIE